jgi:hypothetical protein
MAARRKQTYRKTDLVRALRAAEAAGVKNPRIEIDRHGPISTVPERGEIGQNQPLGKVLGPGQEWPVK